MLATYLGDKLRLTKKSAIPGKEDQHGEDNSSKD